MEDCIKLWSAGKPPAIAKAARFFYHSSWYQSGNRRTTPYGSVEQRYLETPRRRTSHDEPKRSNCRELRVLVAEAKTQRRHLNFGCVREERRQQRVVPHQQLTDQLLSGFKMLPRQSQSVRDQASPTGTCGVQFWPAVRGTNAVFRELVVETIRRLLALLPCIEIDCQVLGLGVNGCSEHTALIQSWKRFPSTCAVIASPAVWIEFMTMLSMRKPFVFRKNEGSACPLSKSCRASSLSQRP